MSNKKARLVVKGNSYKLTPRSGQFRSTIRKHGNGLTLGLRVIIKLRKELPNAKI